MSLNWNAQNAPSWRELDDCTRESIIWLLLAIDMQEISEKNLPELYARIHIWEQVFGGFRSIGCQPVCFTIDELRKAIGLRTNVRTIPRTQFLKKLSRKMDTYASEAKQVLEGKE